jgi:hypothetical protein
MEKCKPWSVYECCRAPRVVTRIYIRKRHILASPTETYVPGDVVRATTLPIFGKDQAAN